MNSVSSSRRTQSDSSKKKSHRFLEPTTNKEKHEIKTTTVYVIMFNKFAASIASDGEEEDRILVLKDYTRDVTSFFNNSRIPASRIVGFSLGALFVVGQFGNDPNRTKLELFLIKLYRLLSWLAFVLSLNAVITCTAATTSILHYENFNPMAKTPYELLSREFEYEFVTTRWSISVSLLLFIFIVTIRTILEFNLLTDITRKNIGKFVLCSSIALFAQLLSYINTTLSHSSHTYTNLVTMTIHLFKNLILMKAIEEPTSMRLVAILSAFAAIYFGIQSATTTTQNGNIFTASKKNPFKEE